MICTPKASDLLGSLQKNGAVFRCRQANLRHIIIDVYKRQAETFTITNTGTGALASLDVTLTGANADSFTLDKTGFNTNLATSGTTTFTIKPNTGLAAGTYLSLIHISAIWAKALSKALHRSESVLP